MDPDSSFDAVFSSGNAGSDDPLTGTNPGTTSMSDNELQNAMAAPVASGSTAPEINELNAQGQSIQNSTGTDGFDESIASGYAPTIKAQNAATSEHEAFEKNFNEITGGTSPGTGATIPGATKSSPLQSGLQSGLSGMGQSFKAIFGQSQTNPTPSNMPQMAGSIAPSVPSFSMPAISLAPIAQPSALGTVAAGNTSINPFTNSLAIQPVSTMSDRRAKTNIKSANKSIYDFLAYLGSKK